MNFTKQVKLSHAGSSKSRRSSRSRIDINAESDTIKAFRKAVKQRPKDTSWLVRYGQLARSMGLSFCDARAVIQAHIKKLCGNRRRGWIENGLMAGYHQIGLTA